MKNIIIDIVLVEMIFRQPKSSEPAQALSAHLTHLQRGQA
ncbi:ArsR family transcriptional regulator [Klebsiella pneumoniae]|nr:ArsR family transcriptional regulator [Klebsiella pneumoniae]